MPVELILDQMKVKSNGTYVPIIAAGTPGVSPAVSISSITGGHTVTITDANHPSGQSFNVMNGTPDIVVDGVSADIDGEINLYAVTYSSQSLNSNAQLQARTNIGIATISNAYIDTLVI